MQDLLLALPCLPPACMRGWEGGSGSNSGHSRGFRHALPVTSAEPVPGGVPVESPWQGHKGGMRGTNESGGNQQAAGGYLFTHARAGQNRLDGKGEVEAEIQSLREEFGVWWQELCKLTATDR